MRRVLGLLAAAVAAAAGLAVAGAAPAAHGIVGGTDALVNPGSVSFWTEDPHRNRCGGTLVDDEWVLTSGHCFRTFTAPLAGEVEMRLGSLDNTVGHYTAYVDSYYRHHGYNSDVLTDDIMLVKLTAPVPASVQKPARLWWTATPGTIGQISSWGWVCDGPAGLDCSSWYTGPLQRMSTRILPDSACATLVDTKQTCFESATGEPVMACPGDSGASLQSKVHTGEEWVSVVRAVVLGDGDDWNGASCTTAPDGSNGLGLGTDIGPYRPWLADVMAGKVAPTPVPDTTVARAAEPLVAAHAFELAG